jgi:hypothetical protein
MNTISDATVFLLPMTYIHAKSATVLKKISLAAIYDAIKTSILLWCILTTKATLK